MRLPLFLAVVISVVSIGCASNISTRAEENSPSAFIAQVSESEASPAAMALAFSPPVTYGQDLPQLSREPREASAFVGYDEQTITSFYVRTDDHQYGNGHDRYDRWAIIERSGASYR